MPLGSDCHIAPISRQYVRDGFSCGLPGLDHPLLNHRFTGRSSIERTTLVASMPDETRVLGYVAVERCDLEMGGVEPVAAYIPWLAVDERFQRRGIGQRLVAEVLLLVKDWDASSPLTAVTLHAEPHLHGFYGRFGFQAIDTRLMVLPITTVRAL